MKSKIYKLLLLASVFFGFLVKGVLCLVIYVPTNYPTIQQAVYNASTGDTIIVKDGVYKENVIVNKSVTLMSENGSANCIIDALQSGDGIKLVPGSEGAIIKGFKIINASTYAGVEVQVPNATIENVVVDSANKGIFVNSIYNTTIKNTTVTNSTNGIYSINGNEIKIIESTFTNDSIGINLFNTSKSSIENNIMSDNEYGYILNKSSEVYLYGNKIYSNKYNVYIENSSNIRALGEEVYDPGVYDIFAYKCNGCNYELKNGFEVKGEYFRIHNIYEYTAEDIRFLADSPVKSRVLFTFTNLEPNSYYKVYVNGTYRGYYMSSNDGKFSLAWDLQEPKMFEIVKTEEESGHMMSSLSTYNNNYQVRLNEIKSKIEVTKDILVGVGMLSIVILILAML